MPPPRGIRLACAAPVFLSQVIQIMAKQSRTSPRNPSKHSKQSGGTFLGVVLGEMLKQTFVTSMIKSDGNLLAFFERPVAATLGVLTLAAWFLPPLVKRMRRLAGA